MLPNNVICLYDFGMMGSMGRSMRELFLELVDAVVNENPVKDLRGASCDNRMG